MWPGWSQHVSASQEPGYLALSSASCPVCVLWLVVFQSWPRVPDRLFLKEQQRSWALDTMVRKRDGGWVITIGWDQMAPAILMFGKSHHGLYPLGLNFLNVDSLAPPGFLVKNKLRKKVRQKATKIHNFLIIFTKFTKKIPHTGDTNSLDRCG